MPAAALRPAAKYTWIVVWWFGGCLSAQAMAGSIPRVLVRRRACAPMMRPAGARLRAIAPACSPPSRVLISSALKILGLGNPGGASYKRGALTALQRHNVGAAALDAIASSLASAQPDSDDGSGSDSGGEDAAGGAGGGGAARPARGRKDAAAAAEWKVEKKLKASIRKVAMPLPPPLLRDYSSGHMSVDVAPSGAAGAAQPGAAGAPSEAELRAAAPLEVEVVLARPKTYMNLSGRAAKRVVEAEGLRADMLCVVHDELELPFGRVRLKNGGSHK